MSIRSGAVLSSAEPSARMPVPESRTTRLSSWGRTSMHDVFPPYRTVSGPGAASDPREPQNLARTSGLLGSLPEHGQPADELIHVREQRHPDDLEVRPATVGSLDPERTAARDASPERGSQRKVIGGGRYGCRLRVRGWAPPAP